jgi:hypothetical protein
MAENEGRAHRPLVERGVEVAVTDAGRLDFYEDFARSGWIELDLLN